MSRRLRERLRLYRPRVWCIAGVERHSGHPLKIVYAGREAHQRYLRTHPDADMLIAESSAGYFQRVAAQRDFFIPLWVEGEILNSRLDQHLRRSLRDDLRKVRKHGYTYEVTRDPAKLRMFHREMYEPYISLVHGDRAALMSLQALLSKADHADLLLVKGAQGYVAGGVFVYESGAVRTWSLGVLHGDHSHVRNGAIAALYYFKILYLKEQGYEGFNAGASRAFLRDGALQYKRKWGMRLTRARDGGFWLQRLSGSPGATAFLEHSPFIHCRHQALQGMAYTQGAALATEADARLQKLQEGLGLEACSVTALQDVPDPKSASQEQTRL